MQKWERLHKWQHIEDISLTLRGLLPINRKVQIHNHYSGSHNLISVVFLIIILALIAENVHLREDSADHQALDLAP